MTNIKHCPLPDGGTCQNESLIEDLTNTVKDLLDWFDGGIICMHNEGFISSKMESEALEVSRNTQRLLIDLGLDKE